MTSLNPNAKDRPGRDVVDRWLASEARDDAQADALLTAVFARLEELSPSSKLADQVLLQVFGGASRAWAWPVRWAAALLVLQAGFALPFVVRFASSLDPVSIASSALLGGFQALATIAQLLPRVASWLEVGFDIAEAMASFVVQPQVLLPTLTLILVAGLFIRRRDVGLAKRRVSNV